MAPAKIGWLKRQNVNNLQMLILTGQDKTQSQ